MLFTLKDLKPEDWTPNHGVPVSESTKQKWIQKAIQYLKDNPDEYWTSMTSGDTFIQVTREGDFYDVQELQPRRYVFIERDPADVSACKCSVDVLNSRGCQCGGI